MNEAISQRHNLLCTLAERAQLREINLPWSTTDTARRPENELALPRTLQRRPPYFI